MTTYTIAMPHPHAHLYEVTLDIDGVAGATLDVALPVWTPGSYMIREYARHVQEFAAAPAPAVPGEEAGAVGLAFHKFDKSTWRIETHSAERVRISYKV